MKPLWSALAVVIVLAACAATRTQAQRVEDSQTMTQLLQDGIEPQRPISVASCWPGALPRAESVIS